MPFDSRPIDDLSDISTSEPLSARSVKRIVRAARRAGFLTMDDPAPRMAQYYGGNPDWCSPHTVVDLFLGVGHRRSCPCNTMGAAGYVLQELERMHFAVFVYRACAPADRHGALLAAQFDELLS
jgi:hypothetical protein